MTPPGGPVLWSSVRPNSRNSPARLRKTHSGVASDLHRAVPYSGGPVVTYTGPGGALQWLGSVLRRWVVPYGGGAGNLHLDRPMALKVMGRSRKRP